MALDDFGTGYSALSYLKKFDIDYLKIDQTFTRNMATDEGDRALCEAIIVLAHKLGLKVIAEGIETMLSLIDAVPRLPVWAALSPGHLGAVLLPEGLQRLYIAIDRDPAGQRAAERLSARATEVGIGVRVLEPILGDFNDDLRAYGAEALRQHLAGQIGPEDQHRLFG